MKDLIVRTVVERLRSERERLRREFSSDSKVGPRYFVVDGLLPDELVRQVYSGFPADSQMRLMSSFRERKYTSKSMDRCSAVVSDAIFALQAPEVIEEVGTITGFTQLEGDPKLYAGGISAMARGHFLNPHIDNSHDSNRKLYRALNALFYVTPDWKAENGGNLELWDTRVVDRVEIPSLFNRFVVMETNRTSWHSVNEVRTGGRRCCVSNYYFSPRSPEGVEYFHVTAFSARPEQPVRRLLAKADNALRMLIRSFVRQGLGRRDVYDGSRPS